MNIVTVILIQKARLLLTRSTAKSKEEIVNIQAKLRCADYLLAAPCSTLMKQRHVSVALDVHPVLPQNQHLTVYFYLHSSTGF